MACSSQFPAATRQPVLNSCRFCRSSTGYWLSHFQAYCLLACVTVCRVFITLPSTEGQPAEFVLLLGPGALQTAGKVVVPCLPILVVTFDTLAPPFGMAHPRGNSQHMRAWFGQLVHHTATTILHTPLFPDVILAVFKGCKNYPQATQ